MTLIMQYSIFSYRERRRDGRPRMAWHGPRCEDAESRQLWRHQQLVSLRRHYPRQVLGRSPRLPLSPFELPFGCAFIMAAPADKRVDACGCWVSGERAVAVRQVEDCRAVDSRLGEDRFLSCGCGALSGTNGSGHGSMSHNGCWWLRTWLFASRVFSFMVGHARAEGRSGALRFTGMLGSSCRIAEEWLSALCVALSGCRRGLSRLCVALFR